MSRTHGGTHPRRFLCPQSGGQSRVVPTFERHRFDLIDIANDIANDDISAANLIKRLTKIRQHLLKAGARRAANGRIDRLIRQVKTFGFHLAHLDFRDNSTKLDGAADELAAEFRAISQIQADHGADAAHRFILSMTRSPRTS